MKKLQAQKQKTETSVKKREATCDKEVKTAEAKAKSTREKLQKAVADFVCAAVPAGNLAALANQFHGAGLH
jgi:chaperonin cofactor prefoldin